MNDQEVQDNGTNTAPDDLPVQMTEEGDSSKSRPTLVPAKDLDALRSVKDKEIALERKQRQELEQRLAELTKQLEVEVSRRQLAESQASEAQAAVNLRNFARQLAQSKYGVWGPEIQKAAEDKFLTAEDRSHLIALEHEFAVAELPALVRQTDQAKRRETKEQKALDETVGLTVGRLGEPSTSTSGDAFAQLDKYLAKARQNRTWKDSPEGIAALREARSILSEYKYPVAQIRDWAQVANAVSSLRMMGIGVAPKRTTRV